MVSASPAVGVVLAHGFTSSLASVTPWAEALRDAGFRVSTPLLPGHGTSWEDLAARTWREWYAAYDESYCELAQDCGSVVAAGISMGGALALRLAGHRDVAGVSVVNPALVVDDPRSHISAALRYAVRTVPAIGNDIKRPGQDEGCYERVPVAAGHQLKLLFRDTVAALPRATAPLQVFRSTVDHVVTTERSIGAIMRRYGGGDIRLLRLANSYHVATLDNDAPEIFARSAAFITEVAGTARETTETDREGADMYGDTARERA